MLALVLTPHNLNRSGMNLPDDELRPKHFNIPPEAVHTADYIVYVPVRGEVRVLTHRTKNPSDWVQAACRMFVSRTGQDTCVFDGPRNAEDVAKAQHVRRSFQPYRDGSWRRSA